MSIKILIATKGYEKIAKKLGVMAATAKRPSIPARQCAIWLVGQTFKAFAVGGKPEKWAPLSLMTLFIREHRANPKFRGGDLGLPGSDSGRLKGSFLPVVTDDGKMFGASTNVDYAEDFQRGGQTEARDIQIASFTRKRSKRQATDYAKGSLTAATERVKAFVMHMKGGNPVEARPFFPPSRYELDSWGYHDKFKEIFALHFGGLKRA